ncbi:hypothetical protein LF95_01755 [Thalassospira sp. TSL5-1]|nr:hypothetical protein LF95_01755 [Thalassospira sp. TSL5-1]
MGAPTLFSEGNKQQLLFEKQATFWESILLQEKKSLSTDLKYKNLYAPDKNLPTHRAAGFS